MFPKYTCRFSDDFSHKKMEPPVDQEAPKNHFIIYNMESINASIASFMAADFASASSMEEPLIP